MLLPIRLRIYASQDYKDYSKYIWIEYQVLKGRTNFRSLDIPKKVRVPKTGNAFPVHVGRPEGGAAAGWPKVLPSTARKHYLA